MTRLFHWRQDRRAGQAATIAGLLVLAAACGCSLMRPARNTGRFYVLTPVQSPASAPGPDQSRELKCVVWIRPVELAGYLRTKEMVLRHGTNEVSFALYHQWAESLDEGIRRVVGQDLQTGQGISVIPIDQPARGTSAVYTVSLRVLACGGILRGGRGSADFEAAWEVRGPDAFVRRGQFEMPPAAWDGRDFGALARGLSRGVEGLAGALRQALSGGGRAPVSEALKR